MQLGTAQLLVGGHFTGGSLEQGRACEEHLGLAANHHHVVGQTRLVGAAGSAGTVYTVICGRPMADMRAWLAKPRAPSTKMSAA